MEKTKYEIELITSDCLKILPTLKTNSFDFSFTDVPYNAGKDYGVYKDNLCEREWLTGTNGINEITAVDTTTGHFNIDTLILSEKV